MNCTIDECQREARYAKTGWCQTHYHRWWRTGSPLGMKTRGFSDPYRLRYRSVHRRVRALFGPACELPCVSCAAPAAEWAYDGTDPTEKTEEIRNQWPVRFSVHPEFYMPMCFPCHRLRDRSRWATERTHCRRGHELTPENIYSPPGKRKRECRTCRSTRNEETE